MVQNSNKTDIAPQILHAILLDYFSNKKNKLKSFINLFFLLVLSFRRTCIVATLRTPTQQVAVDTERSLLPSLLCPVTKPLTVYKTAPTAAGTPSPSPGWVACGPC